MIRAFERRQRRANSGLSEANRRILDTWDDDKEPCFRQHDMARSAQPLESDKSNTRQIMYKKPDGSQSSNRKVAAMRKGTARPKVGTSKALKEYATPIASNTHLMPSTEGAIKRKLIRLGSPVTPSPEANGRPHKISRLESEHTSPQSILPVAVPAEDTTVVEALHSFGISKTSATSTKNEMNHPRENSRTTISSTDSDDSVFSLFHEKPYPLSVSKAIETVEAKYANEFNKKPMVDNSALPVQLPFTPKRDKLVTNRPVYDSPIAKMREEERVKRAILKRDIENMLEIRERNDKELRSIRKQLLVKTTELEKFKRSSKVRIAKMERGIKSLQDQIEDLSLGRKP